MDNVLAILGDMNTSVIGMHHAIDNIKHNYDVLRSARAEYLKVGEKKHFPFFYKRRQEKAKAKFNKIFDELFEDYFYFIKRIKIGLEKLLDCSVFSSNQFADLNKTFADLHKKVNTFAENIDAEYLAKVGIEDFDNELLYSRNLLSELAGKLTQFESRYKNGQGASKYPSREAPQNAEIKSQGQRGED